MVNVEGDIVEPLVLVVPVKTDGYVGKKGEIFLSGDKLWVNVDGTNIEMISSS